MTIQEENSVSGVKKPKSVLGIRHAQVLMLFLAMVLGYAMRVNISIAIVAMTDRTDEHAFNWSIQTQSVILSSFFWGYVVLQIPGGELAARFGGHVLITLAIGINAILSLFIPLGAHYGGWQVVCACRVGQGLLQGFILPSIHYLIGKWAPLEEKSRLGTMIYSGTQFGTALQFMGAGVIAEHWGWPAIFYVTGGLGVIWTAVYIFVGSDTPEKSKMISSEERLYIQTSLGQVGEQKKPKTPWKSIWTSMPFISLIVVHCGFMWGFWTLMTEMPTYMYQVLGVNIKANGFVSALPYLVCYLVSFIFGFLSDYILKKNWVTLTTSRKLSNSIGFFGPAIALIGLSYTPAGNVWAAVALLTLVISLNAGYFTGFMLVHIDMAPNFAGTMVGITNCFANILSITAPLVAGLLLQNETDPGDWRKVFYLSSAIYILTNTMFVIFGTSERQKWNEVPDTTNDVVSETYRNKEQRTV